MVERQLQLNQIFISLADETRRDILRQVSKQGLSVGEIAKHYTLTFAAIAKHIDVLQKAKLIRKDRRGREQVVSISPNSLTLAKNFLEQYETHWEQRLENLDKLLSVTGGVIHKKKVYKKPTRP